LKDVLKINDKWIKIIGIPFIGIGMPVIFYDGSDITGLLLWILISVCLTFIIWVGSQKIVRYLWTKYPWEKRPFRHLLINIFFLAFLSVLLIIILYGINNLFNNYSPGYWHELKGVHVAIILLTFFTTSVYEGIFLFNKWKKSVMLSALLEKENIRAQFEALKNQVNPHFLFNSLSVLASLIPKDTDKALEFVNEFSKIYRYVLEIKDQSAVELGSELKFVKSYIYLQKIRFSDNLDLDLRIDPNRMAELILPLSVQMLIENAIKHNEISDIQPLTITITNNDKSLIIKNNLHPVMYDESSSKTGLKNLKDRYKLLSDLEPVFFIEENEFIAELPFLDNELKKENN